MAAKKKVRRVTIEKAKSGKGKHVYSVEVEHHPTRGKEGKGMHAGLDRYEPPEKHLHKSHGDATKHVKSLLPQMTATPDEEPEEKIAPPAPPGGSQDGARGDEDEED